MKSRLSNIHKTIILFVLVVFITLLLSEGFLRAVLPSPINWKFPQEAYQFDPEIGYWLLPDQTAYTHDKKVSINTFGCRDKEFNKKTNNSSTRIVAIGDSQTFGNGLEINATWPKQLENTLKNTNGDWEVINCGIPATDTWQHEIIARRIIEQYRPDILALAVYVNDIRKNPDHKPANITTHQQNEVTQRLIYLAKSSVLALFLRQQYQRFSSHDNGAKYENAVVYGDNEINLDAAWRDVEKSLININNFTKQHKTRFIIALLPRRDQILDEGQHFSYNEKFKDIAQRNQFEFVDILPMMKKHKDNLLFIPWDGHNNKLANSLVAQGFYSLLQEKSKHK